MARFTLVHDRFQAVCLEGCGHINSHSKLLDAVQSAKTHSCVQVVVYDNMTKKSIHANRWERAINDDGVISEAWKRFKPETGKCCDQLRANKAKGATQ